MKRSRQISLWSLFILQAGCTLFFVSDAAVDWFGPQPQVQEPGDLLEALITLCLVVSTVFTAFEIRNMLVTEKRLRQQIGVASGAFADILQTQFDVWGLTESEKIVALMGIKGYSISEIAEIRETKEGTIKAQNAAVYRKAGVSGRLQLLSHFVEDLIGEALIVPEAQNSAK